MQKLIDVLNRDALRPFRFMIVGGVATLTHLVVAALVLALHPNTLPYLVNIIAFFVAFTVFSMDIATLPFRHRALPGDS